MKYETNHEDSLSTTMHIHVVELLSITPKLNDLGKEGWQKNFSHAPCQSIPERQVIVMLRIPQLPRYTRHQTGDSFHSPLICMQKASRTHTIHNAPSTTMTLSSQIDCYQYEKHHGPVCRPLTLPCSAKCTTASPFVNFVCIGPLKPNTPRRHIPALHTCWEDPGWLWVHNWKNKWSN